MQLELAVGKYQRTIFMGCKDVFCGIVDGMCQQIDVIASLLDVGDILYISFQGNIAVLVSFAGECFQADIKDFFV